MKRSVISFAVLLLVVAAGCSTRTVKNEQSINPLLGDASFVHTFGHAPSANADEDVRIATHLAYVEQLLRDADVSAWSPAQRERRAAVVDCCVITAKQGCSRGIMTIPMFVSPVSS